MVIKEDIGQIERKIVSVRGRQVILDRDLAALYGVETKSLNQTVRRNLDRFPDDFMFILDLKEESGLKSQIVTSSWGGNRKPPLAFTEQGVAMLSGLLRSKRAVEANILIMRAFVQMRHLLLSNAHIINRVQRLEEKQEQTEETIGLILDKLGENDLPRQGIFFDNQVFDAFAFVSSLIKKAKTSITLIDNYIDEKVFTLLDYRSDEVKATIYTKNIDNKTALALLKHNEQYKQIEIVEFNKSHDRFLLIDDETYHIGASLKDLGKRWFAFSLLKDVRPNELLLRIARW